MKYSSVHAAAAEPAAPQSEALPSQSPLPESPPTPWRKRGLSGAYRDPFIWVTSLAVFGAYLAISLLRLLQLNPTSWDLAIYTEYVKPAASWHAPVADVRTAGFNLLGDHFQPIVMMIAPLLLAARTDTFWIGNSGNPTTRYIVFDGLNSDYSPAISNVPALIAQIYPGHIYTQIFQSGDVYVFRRTTRPAPPAPSDPARDPSLNSGRMR